MKNNFFILITVFFTAFCAPQAYAQGWVWAKDAMGTGGSGGDIVKTDAFGNVYVSGKYNGTITFGTTTLTYDSNANHLAGIFLVKYDSLGNVLWARGGGGTGWSIECMTIDRAGNIYLSDGFDTITFGTVTLTACGRDAIYIVKYDAEGNLIWAKTASGCITAAFSFIGAIAMGADSACNIYITGEYGGNPLSFGTTTLTPTSPSSNLFTVKYDSSGNVIWAKGESGGSGLGTWVNSLATDRYNNVYITGIFSDTITFGATTLSAGTALFLVKYNAAGDVVWATTEGDWWSEGIVLTTDIHGNVYLSGQYDSTITFGATTLTVSGQAIFLVKYDSGGNAIWAKGSTLMAGGTQLYSLSADLQENIYACGSFTGLIAFGDSTISTLSHDFFLIKFDTSGDVAWTNTGGGGSACGGSSVSNDTIGNVYITGNFGSPSFTFGHTILTTSTSSGTMFLSKYSEKPLNIANSRLQNSRVQLYPNPAADKITLSFNYDISISGITIFDLLGRPVLNCPNLNFSGQSINMKLPFLPDGMYFLHAISAEGIDNMPFVIRR